MNCSFFGGTASVKHYLRFIPVAIPIYGFLVVASFTSPLNFQLPAFCLSFQLTIFGLRFVIVCLTRLVARNVAVTGEPDAPALHIWLNPTSASESGSQQSVEATEAAGDVHVCWPYRFRVITAEVLPTPSDEVGLQSSETLQVCVVVDRVRVPAVAADAEPLPLPEAGSAATRVWLSTQGERQVALGGGGASPSDEDACAPLLPQSRGIAPAVGQGRKIF